MQTSMSWLRDTEEAAKVFQAARAAREGFAKPFVVPAPQFLFFKALFCYPLRGESFYYMSLSEYTSILLLSEREVAEREGWPVVEEAILRARADGFVKDPPLVAAQILPSSESIARLLATYPITKVLLYAEIAKERRALGWSWGHRKKAAIERAVASKELEWHELQAVKHPRALRDLLRLAHPKPPSEEVSRIWRWALGKGEAPTERIREYEDVVRLAAHGDRAGAVRAAVEANLPWEVLRSRVGLGRLPRELLAEAAEKLLSPHDTAMQARTLADALGAEFVAELVRKRSCPLNAGARAALGLLQAHREAAEAFFEKVRVERSAFERMLPLKPRRVVALVDVSASMSGTRIQSAARVLMPFRSVFEKAYAFNEAVAPIELSSLSDFEKLLQMPDKGTRLYDSVIEVARSEQLGEDDLLFVATDEQENYSRARLQDVLSLKANVVEAVVAPYPADMVLKTPVTHFVAYPASDPDALVASARLVLAGRVAQSEKVVELHKLLPSAPARHPL